MHETQTTRIFRRGGSASDRADGFADDAVVREEPLEVRVSYVRDGGVRVDRAVAVTLRTPGADAYLAVGFLFAEGLLESATDIEEVTADEDCVSRSGASRVVVTLKAGVTFRAESLNRNFFANSSCGACGKATLEALNLDHCRPIDADGFSVAEEQIVAASRRARAAQPVFAATGGLHGAALFTRDGALIRCFEDVGRHNALDKLVGWMLRDAPDVRPGETFLFLSGRVGFEMVQKAVRAGIPLVAAVGAPTSAAVEVADHFKLTLIGFLRGSCFNVYAQPERIEFSQSP